MRKTLFFFMVIFYIFFNYSFSQEKDIREDLIVTNVEVPVRVFFKGEQVKGLKQSDFILFEAGKQQTINGFYEVAKVISKESIKLSTGRTEEYKARYFVLVFRVMSVPGDLVDSIKYLFNDVLKKNDQLLVFINNKTMFLKNLNDKEQTNTLLIRILKEEAVKEKFRFEQYFLKVVDSLNRSRLQSQLEKDHIDTGMVSRDIIIFLRNYLRIFVEYKKKFLLPDIDNYYNFSKFLEKIGLEKWVISFYQFEKFPELKLSGKFRTDLRSLLGKMQIGSSEIAGNARIISRLMNTIDRELKVADDFPSAEISRMFSKVNTTFHSLFFTTMNDNNSQDFSFKEISTDLENTLRGLTKATGGELIVSNSLEESLAEVVKKEDSYYMLTYSPESTGKKGKIRVRVKNKGYKVHYDNNIRADYIEDYLKKRASEVTFVKLDNIECSKKILKLRIADIMQRDDGNGMKGAIKLHIVIKTPDDEILYDKSKILNTKKRELSIEIKMDWMKPGKYDLTLDAADIMSGRSAFEYKKIKIK